jgi:hypothetical protein
MTEPGVTEPGQLSDAELESRAEDRSERRLFWRELAIVLVLVALVVLRTLVV